jgi:hypothetical protein
LNSMSFQSEMYQKAFAAIEHSIGQANQSTQ